MWNKNIRKSVIVMALVAAFASLAGCTMSGEKQGDPKKRLTEYISHSFAVRGVEDRGSVQSYLTGQAKTRLTAWSDDQFRQAFVEAKRQFVRLVFTEEKRKSPTEVDITYELTYVDQGRGHDAKVTNKKLCQMVLEDGTWLIRDVHNIMELVQYRNEMSFPY